MIYPDLSLFSFIKRKQMSENNEHIKAKNMNDEAYSS